MLGEAAMTARVADFENLQYKQEQQRARQEARQAEALEAARMAAKLEAIRTNHAAVEAAKSAREGRIRAARAATEHGKREAQVKVRGEKEEKEAKERYRNARTHARVELLASKLGKLSREQRKGIVSAVPDCGTCKYCLDKPRFGGPNVHKRVRAPPPSLTFDAAMETPRGDTSAHISAAFACVLSHRCALKRSRRWRA